jgi:hypothetical protein
LGKYMHNFDIFLKPHVSPFSVSMILSSGSTFLHMLLLLEKGK